MSSEFQTLCIVLQLLFQTRMLKLHEANLDVLQKMICFTFYAYAPKIVLPKIHEIPILSKIAKLRAENGPQ